MVKRSLAKNGSVLEAMGTFVLFFCILLVVCVPFQAWIHSFNVMACIASISLSAWWLVFRWSADGGWRR